MIRYLCGAAIVGLALHTCARPADDEATHVRTEFHFTLDIPYASAAPLFGADAERKWSEGWNPRFLYPAPPADQEGAVFRVDHGASHSSVWINTVFDLPAGHVQYVFILNQAVITRIDIHLTRNGSDKTDVTVAYERTALDPAANEHVRSLAHSDAAGAKDWKPAIEAYWKRR
ncbi:MAG TPA: hypothetical protein VLY04_24465 [Bryobacteraceae bacterium]|nr:hypothetical protein [Bryobacteraceae bacterium]